MKYLKLAFSIIITAAIAGCHCGGEEQPETAAMEPDEAEIVYTETDMEPPPVPAENLQTRSILSTLPLGIIGEEEPVFIENIPTVMPARIDTGASLCSMDASEIKYFERDGKTWVSFRITDRTTEKEYAFEKRVKRKVKIKRHDEDDPPTRPLVEIKIRLGHMTFVRDFTLIDRKNFNYPVLIGRNLLSGLAAVDVSRSNTLAE